MTAVIQQLATPYAADLMLKQLTVAKGLTCDVVEEEDMIVHIKSTERKEGNIAMTSATIHRMLVAHANSSSPRACHVDISFSWI